MAGRTRAGIRRGWPVLALAAFTVLGSLPSVDAADDPPLPEETAQDKIGSELLAELPLGGEVDFIVEVAGSADLSSAFDITDWAERGRYVYDTLNEHAERTQAGVRVDLDARGVDYTAFWIANVIHVTGDRATVDVLAGRGEVKSITLAQEVPIPDPEPAPRDVTTQQSGPTWGLAAIGAPRVWKDFAARGEGIVIGVLDSGAEHDHPALSGAYRGNNGDGTFSHDYNWYDPAGGCPSDEPCDLVDHGTHVTGTAVGDDGAGNQIGVAPGAQWIAAKGCQTTFCADLTLFEAGQWMLAPTDRNGNNPRPGKRPHIVNNSWGGPGGDPWYRNMVDAWIAAGMFPMFAGGNEGPWCGTISSPGDYAQSYSIGGFNRNGNLFAYSSRGPAPPVGGGGVKPNITAPAVGVRSAVPGGGYDSFSGTSMAAPHVSGTVALLWSKVPGMVGDIAATRTVLDGSAVDTGNLQCGGTPERNNVFGEGKLDAHAAMKAATSVPDGPKPPEKPRFVDPDPDFRLDDIPRGHLFDFEIHWLAANGITRGCNPPANTRFCPDDSVTRGQMAAFLVRALSLAPGAVGFEDTRGHVFERDVAALAAAGITRGCNPPGNTRFCPSDPVTRGQMAAFLYRALGR